MTVQNRIPCLNAKNDMILLDKIQLSYAMCLVRAGAGGGSGDAINDVHRSFGIVYSQS